MTEAEIKTLRLSMTASDWLDAQVRAMGHAVAIAVVSGAIIKVRK